MTLKLFWEDAYKSSFEGQVLSVDGNKVVLDQTAFNPKGGGLVSDTGKLGGGRVLEVLKEGDRKSTRLNSSHRTISYAVFCLKKKKIEDSRKLGCKLRMH